MPAETTAPGPLSMGSELSLIEIEGVHKRFATRSGDVQALQGVDLQVAEREFISLLGPSGCGKSTLVRLLAGLDRPTEGRLRINLREADRTAVSVAFQDYSILPWKTVENNVAFGLRMQGHSRKEALSTARHWLGVMKLSGFEKAYPAQLSGGMKQRVALARALALDPALLLLDEPFAALDAQMRQLLQEDILRQWEQDRTRTAVAVTHDIDEAILLSDRVVLMTHRPGRIKEIFDVPIPRPRTPEVRYEQAFVELRHVIWESLRAEVQAQVSE